MPQPKKSGGPARKTTARKPASKSRSTSAKSSARKPARKTAATRSASTARKSSSTARKSTSTARKSTTTGKSATTRKPAARKPAAKAAPRRKAATARSREGNLGAVRELLTRGFVITGDRLQETMDEAVKRGRMTREDAEELVQSLIQIGRKQTQDLLAELDGLVGRGRTSVESSADQTRRRTRSRVKGVTTAARRAPGTDRALQQVDKARRAARVGSTFPVIGYDDLTAAQIAARLDDLKPAELRKVRDHERRNANRKSVLASIEKKLG